MAAKFVVLAILACASASPLMFGRPRSMESVLLELNMTMEELFPVSKENDFVYSYGQSSAHFSGPAFDGGQISVTGCSGLNHVDRCGLGNCRNNPADNCCKDCGPCPRGQWRLSQEVVYHNMPHCYVLNLVSGGCSDRSGFLIHGGESRQLTVLFLHAQLLSTSHLWRMSRDPSVFVNYVCSFLKAMAPRVRPATPRTAAL